MLNETMRIFFLKVQNSDGLGAGLKQHPINIRDCELYVSFCKSGIYTIRRNQILSLGRGLDGLVIGGLS